MKRDREGREKKGRVGLRRTADRSPPAIPAYALESDRAKIKVTGTNYVTHTKYKYLQVVHF